MSNQVVYSDRELFLMKLDSYQLTDKYLECKDENGVLMQIYFISDHILRFRYSIEGYFEKDFSYAISPDFESPKITPEIDETADHLYLKTAAITCRIDKIDCGVTIFDKEGFVINEDEKGFHWEKNEAYGGHIVQMTKRMSLTEAYYGLGDKPVDLNLRGFRFENWGSDQYGYTRDTDPLYKSIPFYYGLRDGRGYGIFFDNTFKSEFDFGQERINVMSFWAQGGEMNYYFIAGPNLMDVCKRYTLMTGTPEMPPLWSLGYQQCKWSYYPESNVKEVTSKMRELKIPCDAIYLDIDYMDGFRCFTWDKEKFPDPKRMVAELADDGYKTMVIIDPGIKRDMDYSVFTEGLEKGYFCRRVDGPYVEGKVWPGECYFPDFTNPEVREWWAGLYKELIEDIGIAGVWNDMNEPALFEVESKTFPLDVVHDYDGHPTSHRKAHNIYGMQMARATADGVKRHAGGKRSLIITRSGYAGMQRYSSVWTGDNIANWDHLIIADVQTQRLAISGVSFAGSDIGGFIEQPSAELMIRWIQLGVFHPFCRVHSSGDHGDQEPWSFGDLCVEMFRKFVELRYELLPYHYTAFYQYHKEGLPISRPLVFEDQGSLETKDRDHEFMCGDHILVCPVVQQDSKSRTIYLPQGRWYDYWNDQIYPGRTEQAVLTPIDQIPLFIREGAVIPTFPSQQYVGEKTIDTVTLHVYPTSNEEVKSYLYTDNYEDYGYEKGQYRYTEFSVRRTDDHTIQLQRVVLDGDYEEGFTNFAIKLRGGESIESVKMDGENLEHIENIISRNFSLIEIKIK